MRKSMMLVTVGLASAAVLTVSAGATAVGSEPFSLANSENLNLVAAPADGGEGAPVALAGKDGSPLQHWIPLYRGGGQYIFQNTESKRCLIATGRPGSQIYQADCTDKPYELWRVRVNPEGTGINVISAGGGCLDTEGGTVAPGVSLVENGCGGGQSQVWVSVSYQQH